MRELITEPLNAAAFAPYGDVLDGPHATGRVYYDEGLSNGRPNARPSLSLVQANPLPSLPLIATKMERHQFSSQSFVPIDVSRWLVIVAPKHSDGGPDTSKVRAFAPSTGQGVTFHADVWHHPLAVFDQPARFVIVMWLERSNTDEELVSLDAPFSVRFE